MLNSVKEFIDNFIKELISIKIPKPLIILTLIIFSVSIFIYINNIIQNKIKGGENNAAMFVLYYVDWCPHCKVVKPEREKLENDTSIKNVAITKVNCEKDEKAAEENNIEGFPTILFTQNNKVEAYEGGREYEDFKKFLMSKNL